MIYFNSDMSKSTNTVVYFDWKTVIYIYVCGKCRTQFILPMEKSVTFTGACANEIIPSINRSFVYKAKEGRHVRITLFVIVCVLRCSTHIVLFFCFCFDFLRLSYTLCCQFLWIVHFWLPLRYSLTFIWRESYSQL